MDQKETAQARLDAIEVGRLAGKLEAESRREVGEIAEERIKRAMAYAAYDFDGRPADSKHMAEFGLKSGQATPSLERAPLPSGAVSKDEGDNNKTFKRKIGGGRRT